MNQMSASTYLRLIKKLVAPYSGMLVHPGPEPGFPSVELRVLDHDRGVLDTLLPGLRYYLKAIKEHDIAIEKETGNAYQYAFDALFDIFSEEFEDEVESYLHNLTGEEKTNYTSNLIGLGDYIERYDYYGDIEKFYSRRINNICERARPGEDLSLDKDLFVYQKQYLLACHAQKYISLLMKLAGEIIFQESEPVVSPQQTGGYIHQGPSVPVIALFLSYLINAKIEERDLSVKNVARLAEKYGFTQSANTIRADLYRLDKDNNKINNSRKHVSSAIELLESDPKFSNALKLAKNDLYFIGE